MNAPTTVRILALMEAASVTGPAKNLIGFCKWLQTAEGAQSGLKVAVATFDRNARVSESDSFAGTARAAGIETHIIRERHRFDFGVIRQLREIVAQAQPDIIQTHNSKSHLLLKCLPALRANRLWFAFEHGLVYMDLKVRLYNQLDHITLRSADRVVSVCGAFTPRLVASGVKPDQIRVLHNAAIAAKPILDSERARLRDELGIRDGEPVILTIGRLSNEKGHGDLLRALGRLRTSPRQWKLVVVGVGPERDALVRLARALGISDRVAFVGFHADVAGFYAIADVLVLASRSEGSSNVLLEAMMAKVPIAATCAGGNPELVLDEETGLLAPVGDPERLAQIILRLLEEPDTAMRFANSAYLRAMREFSLERYQRRLVAFYAEALGKPHDATDSLAPYSGHTT